MDRSAAFDALQSRLLSLWPAIGAPTSEPKTMVVVPSLSLDVPDELMPLIPAYEERYLFLLLLLRQPNARVIYVTSNPILPSLVDYYLSLVPGLDEPETRDRLDLVSIGDPLVEPLTKKLLERPRTLARIRSLIGDPERAHLVPFTTTQLEEELAVELGIPMYGATSDTLHFGTKTGSREVFEAEGVPHPRGFAGVGDRARLEDALRDLRRLDRPPDEAVIKLDRGIGGLGNALVDLRRDDVSAAVEDIALQGQEQDRAAFLEELRRQSGVVEERIAGDEIRSPSVQLRIAPTGDLEVLSTHDQVLGGPSGQEYHGARFPADPSYAAAITEHAEKVGRHLAARGVIGRFAVDFVVVRNGLEWDAYAIEINLRKGGTTHPFLTMQLLTNGTYDASAASFTAPTGNKYYVATDHLEDPRLRTLIPDDLVDLAREEGLSWDPGSETGVVFHMISALPVVGRIGFTAIADGSGEADDLYRRAHEALVAATDHPRPG